MKRFGYLLLLLVIPSLFSCEKWQENQLDFTKKQTLYGITYGPHSRHKLDIALPANRTTQTPVVIFIHGGAWVAGDKSVFAQDIQDYADQGMACATINYRFANENKNIHHPELIADIRRAVDFIVSKSDKWMVSTSRFGLVGHSAGGHLSLATAYQLNGDGKIKACASWAGPVDLLDADQRAISIAPELFDVYVGTSLNTPQDSLLYQNASPFWTVNTTSAPTLLVYASEDELVPYSNGLKMKTKLENLGVVSQFAPLTGASHTWSGTYLQEARTTTMSWFQQNL
ncbi:MAG: alpha/beta hydrolase [Flavobacteriales bacterium]|nr:alpha/beta hydrolase [Flavobacteriales bacterium]